MIWLLSIPVLWFLGRKCLWLYEIHHALQSDRCMHIHFQPGDASALMQRFPQIDGSALHQLTHELQTLGFVFLGDLIVYQDYAPQPSPAARPPIPDPHLPPQPAPLRAIESTSHGVMRVCAHPAHGCYGILLSHVTEVRRPAPPGGNDTVKLRVAPFRTSIVSLSDDATDLWSYSTRNRELDAIKVLHRHPHHLDHHLTGQPPSRLLQVHLAERAEIARRGRIHWDTAVSLDKYQAFERQGIRHGQKVYAEARTLQVAWLMWTFRLRNRNCWMGDLAN